MLAPIDSALTSFGESVRIVVYYELKSLFGLLREDIPLKPEKFDETLEKIFGVGAVTIRQVILAKLEESSRIKNLANQGLASAIRTVYRKNLEKIY